MPTNDRACYLDSSALVKLVIKESESTALRRHLASRHHRTSSEIAQVEVVRAVRKHGPEAVVRAKLMLEKVKLLTLDSEMLNDAADLGPPTLRSLDAIHLAAAMTLRDEVDELITYDRRMAEAATDLGFKTASPK